MLPSSTLRSAREHLQSIRPSSSTARSLCSNLWPSFAGATHASPCINNSSPVEEGEACGAPQKRLRFWGPRLAPTDAEPPFAAATQCVALGAGFKPAPRERFFFFFFVGPRHCA